MCIEGRKTLTRSKRPQMDPDTKKQFVNQRQMRHKILSNAQHSPSQIFGSNFSALTHDLPKLGTDLVTTLPRLKMNDLQIGGNEDGLVRKMTLFIQINPVVNAPWIL